MAHSIYSKLDNMQPQGAFNDNTVFEVTPVEQLTAQYGLIDNKVETFSATGGSVSATNSLFTCQSGTSVGGYGTIRTRRPLVYKAGQGLLFRATASFTSPVALSTQLCGLFSLIDGLFFEYNGLNFCVTRRYGGQAEIQRLQVTGAAGGSENATITIDGTGYTVALTTGTVEHNAYEIAADLTSQIGSSWNFEQVGDEVVMVAKAVGDKTGSFSFSSSTATGSFTEQTAGVGHSYERYYIDSSAGDEINGVTPANFDPTKMNIYQIKMAYLGIGNIQFQVYCPNSGRFVTLHTFRRANSETIAHIENPSLFGGWASASLGSSGTNLTVTGSSLGLFIEGKSFLTAGSRGEDATNTAVGTSFENILTIRCRQEMNGRPNISYIIPKIITVASESTKNTIVEVLVNATLGETDYTYKDQSNSIATYDIGTYTVSGGRKIANVTLSGGGGGSIDLTGLDDYIIPGDTLTIAAKVSGGSAAAVSASMVWKEDL